MSRKMLVLSLSLALAVITAFAQTTDQSKNLKDMQKQATQLDNKSRQGQEIVLDSLSKQLNIPVDMLKAQQTKTNFGPGQLFITNSLAAASGKTFDQIAQEFKSGKGWGEIAKEYDLNLGKVVSGLKRANKQTEENQAEQARANGSKSGSGSGSFGSANEGQRGNSGAGAGSYGADNAGRRGNSMGQAGAAASGRGRR